MDGKQLGRLKSQHEALKRLTELIEMNNNCAVNSGRHSSSTVKFREPDRSVSTQIRFIHNKDGAFEVQTDVGSLTLSDKSRNALEAMSSTMAAVVKSVLNEELAEMKKAFGEISIDGYHTTEIDEEL